MRLSLPTTRIVLFAAILLAQGHCFTQPQPFGSLEVSATTEERKCGCTRFLNVLPIDTINSSIHGSANFAIQTNDIIVVGAESRSIITGNGAKAAFRAQRKIGLSGRIAYATTGRAYLGATYSAIELADKAAQSARDAHHAVLDFTRMSDRILKAKFRQMKHGAAAEQAQYRMLLDTLFMTAIFGGFIDNSPHTYLLRVIPHETNGNIRIEDSVEAFSTPRAIYSGFGQEIGLAEINLTFRRTNDPILTVREGLRKACIAHPLELGDPIYIVVITRDQAYWYDGAQPPIHQENPFTGR